MSWEIAHGDVLKQLKALPDNSIDGLFCDPPYGLKFMGKRWDYDVPSVEVWREALRVLKPGANLLSFGGSRTYHRITTAIEDAGFEIRDCLMWLYGKGFPKSQNISLAIDKSAGATREVIGSKTPLAEQWDGYGTALKPAFEPIILARKPLDETMVENVKTWGVGGLSIEACKIDRDPEDRSGYSKSGCKSSNNISMSGSNYARPARSDSARRWPANLLLDEDAADILDASTKPTKSVPYRANKVKGEVLSLETRNAGGYDEPASGPSRFFYCAKVSTKEREAGCESLPLLSAGEATNREDGSDGLNSPRAGANHTGGARNSHPTLKPISLTTWLASLIKPPTDEAILLVPYSGAGSEMIGALKAGWPSVLGIEGEVTYIEIAKARINHWIKEREAA